MKGCGVPALLKNRIPIVTISRPDEKPLGKNDYMVTEIRGITAVSYIVHSDVDLMAKIKEILGDN